jgi:CP family cyanate transporter-like MFS transporter
MPDTSPLPLWAGRSLALIGILLMALNLRTAVAAISPIVAEIRADIPLDTLGLGIIGALPPVAFALSGLFGARLGRRFGLEPLLLAAIGMMVAGHLLRGSADTYQVLLAGSIIAFAGIGIGNILLPPLVKRYFPDRIALMTTAYVSLMAISGAVPALLAAPVAEAAGWRASLGMWSILAAVTLVPWLVVIVRAHRERQALGSDARARDTRPASRHHTAMWRSRTAWALAMVFSLTSFQVYALISWLPRLLIETAGVTPLTAGGYLALYVALGLPLAIVIPRVISRLADVSILVVVGIALLVVGYLGLLLAPGSLLVLWVSAAGIGTIMFPGVLTLINLRTRTTNGSAALSGFVQGIGYAVAVAGPITFGLLHEATGGWTLPLVTLIAAALACVVPALMLRRRAFTEDEIAEPLAR